MYVIHKLTIELLETYADSYLETLSALTPPGIHTPASLHATLSAMHHQGTIVLVAVDDTDGIIGTCSLLIEHKLSRGGTKAAHIEELVVHPNAQAKGIGTALLEQAKQIALAQGCYKILLDCDPKLQRRYEHQGFHQGGIMMRIDL